MNKIKVLTQYKIVVVENLSPSVWTEESTGLLLLAEIKYKMHDINHFN